MPTIGIFHTQYWEFSDTNAPPPPSTNAGGYPAWQASVITPSLFGIVGAWIDARWALVRWHWRVARRIHRLPTEARALIVYTLDTVESPAFSKAQAAVRKTATTLNFANDPVRAGVIKYMKAEAGRLDNVYRHLHACRTLSETLGSTLANHSMHFATELAYQGFAITRK